MLTDEKHESHSHNSKASPPQWCHICPDLPAGLRSAYARTQRIAQAQNKLRFAQANEHYENDKPPPEITPGDLHRYITASSKAWHARNDDKQIPASQISAELTAIAHLVRIKAEDAGVAVPAHPIPVVLPAPQNRLDHVVHRDGMAKLQAIDAGLHRICESGIDQLSDTAVLGLLCVSAAIHCGVLNLHEQRALIRSLGQPINATGQWWHLDLQLRSGKKEELELRRVFLHPLAAAIHIICVERLRRSDNRSLEKLSDSDDTRLNRFMNGAVKAFCRVAGLSIADAPDTLSSILAWEAVRLRLSGMPVLEAYATRSNISHSVPLNVFRRWNSLAPIESSADQDTNDHEGFAKPDDVGPAGRASSLTAHLGRPLDDIRRVFRNHNSLQARRIALNACRESYRQPFPGALECLIDFGEALASGRVRGNKKQKGVSISQLMLSIGPAWLSATAGRNLNALDQQDIEAVCIEILDQNSAARQRRRVARPLLLFLNFLEDQGYLTGLDLPEIPRALGMLAVSANAPTPQEAAGAAKVMLRASAFGTLEEREAAAAMVQVAAACGLRRNEILHVQARDLHWGSDGSGTLVIRPNEVRDLKSPGARRLVPLELAPREAKDRLKRWSAGVAPATYVISSAIGATVATYEWRFFPTMNQALKQSLGDNGFHFHHLRHGAATNLMLGLLGPELDLNRFAGRAPWLKDALATSRRDRVLLTGNSGATRKLLTSISALLGHSSPRITAEHYIHCFDLLLHAQYDNSHCQTNTAQLSGLLKIGHRTAQRWASGGTAYTMHMLEKRYRASFTRDDCALVKQTFIEEAQGDDLTLYPMLEKHWLRMRREQRYRGEDPHRVHRPPSEAIGKIIDALNSVGAIQTEKRGATTKTHGLDTLNRISLPPALSGGHARGTAIHFAGMLHQAFMQDAEKARKAICIWSEHTSKGKGFFRLNADDGSMRWLIESGCLLESWHEWAREGMNLIARRGNRRKSAAYPPKAEYFRLSRPVDRAAQNPRTERQAIWWVLSMSHALIKAGIL